MKILLLSQGRGIADQPDFDAAFRSATSFGLPVKVINMPYAGCAREGTVRAFCKEILHVNDEFRPDVVFFQFFHGAGAFDPVEVIELLRKTSNKPLIFSSCGDLFDLTRLGRWGRVPERELLSVAGRSDAFFITSMGNVVRRFVKEGAKNIFFLPHGYCPCHFGPISTDVIESVRDIQVSMMTSVGVSMRRLRGTLTRSIERMREAYALRSEFGVDFKLYGNGWHGLCGCSGGIGFADQIKIFRRSCVVVDGCPPIRAKYYASDRPFFIAGAGAILVMSTVPRLEKVFRPGENVFFVDHSRDLAQVCQKIIRLPGDVRERMTLQTLNLINSRHLVSHRVDTIISVAEALILVRQGRLSVRDALRHVRMWHFLPDIALESEYQHCVANWVG